MQTQTRAPFASWYALAALSMAVLYAVIDRQVLILLAQPLKTALHLSDTQIGSLQGLGAALFTAIAVVPLGWLADRIDRRIILAACILVWTAAIASCGMATGYWSLLLCVAFLAAGEAGLTPIVFALIPDLFPERQRMTANFIFYGATIVGAGAGIALAGAVIDHIGLVARFVEDSQFSRETWRLVFFVVAVPGPLLALAIVAIRLKQRPPRTRTEGGVALAHNKGEMSGYLASHWKAVVGILVPGGLVSLGIGALFIWLPVILTRQFASSAGDIGTGLGIAVAIGTLTGLAATVAGAKFLRSMWGDATPIRLSQLGYFLLAVLTPLYVLARSPTEIFVIAGVQMAAVIGGNSLMPTMLQDLAPASLRGRVLAISTMSSTLSQVISPIAVGLLSDHVFTGAGGLLLSSLSLAGPGFLVAAITLRLAEKHVLRTAEAVKAVVNAA